MDDFKQWLARLLLNTASRLLQTRREYNGARGWMFDNDWRQPVSANDQTLPSEDSSDGR